MLINVARPRKLIYLAVDGVAPRAKMNQQRSRRFRTAKEKADRISKWVKSGKTLSPNVHDSNMITPGTTFMVELNERLRQ